MKKYLLLVLFIILIVQIWFLMSYECASSVVPGWHTVVSPDNTCIITTCAVMTLTIINVLVIVYLSFFKIVNKK